MLDFSKFDGDKSFFAFFEKISKIPRGSGHCEKIADYLVDFANSRNLFSYRDEYNNVVIKKTATTGYETSPTVILQGHTDMVITKKSDCDSNIESDGVSIYIDGDFLRARGTTLGADDGVAVAYMLAILDSNELSHPSIEAVFTADEEIGLIGAGGLDASVLSGNTMINLDSDSEGVLIAGCAGGIRLDMTANLNSVTVNEYQLLEISGLLGGHSGGEITAGRINAIKLLCELIPEGTMIGDIQGGNADNAIPAYARCKLSADTDISPSISEALAKLCDKEKNLKISCDKFTAPCELFTKEDSAKILALIKREHYGPIEMNEDIPTLPETSMNLGIIKTDENTVTLTASIRSASQNKKLSTVLNAEKIAENLGFSIIRSGDYPGWEFKKNSPLREAISNAFEKLYCKKTKTIIIHAGLECGLFSGKIENLDCVSTGPTAYDIHTPDERLSISSAIRVYKLLCRVLSDLKEKNYEQDKA